MERETRKFVHRIPGLWVIVSARIRNSCSLPVSLGEEQTCENHLSTLSKEEAVMDFNQQAVKLMELLQETDTPENSEAEVG